MFKQIKNKVFKLFQKKFIFLKKSGAFIPRCGIIYPEGGRLCLLVSTYTLSITKEEL